MLPCAYDRPRIEHPAQRRRRCRQTSKKLKRQFLQSDEEFRQLATQHHDLDERLHNYADRHYLTEPEQLEEVTLKKAEAAPEGSDGEHPAPSRRRRRAGPRGAALTLVRHSVSSSGPAAGPRSAPAHAPATGPLRRCTASFRYENRSRRVSVHRGRAGPGRHRGGRPTSAPSPPRSPCWAASSTYFFRDPERAGAAGRRAGRRRRPTAG